MAFPVRNNTTLKPGMLCFEQLVAVAQAAAERFAIGNPHWAKTTFIAVRYSRSYRAYVASVRYTSNQGTTTVSTHTHTTTAAD